MLILQRKEGEILSFIEGKILVTVVKIFTKSVRLGIEADKSIRIDRAEQFTSELDHVCECKQCGRRG